MNFDSIFQQRPNKKNSYRYMIGPYHCITIWVATRNTLPQGVAPQLNDYTHLELNVYKLDSNLEPSGGWTDQDLQALGLDLQKWGRLDSEKHAHLVPRNEVIAMIQKICGFCGINPPPCTSNNCSNCKGSCSSTMPSAASNNVTQYPNGDHCYICGFFDKFASPSRKNGKPVCYMHCDVH